MKPLQKIQVFFLLLKLFQFSNTKDNNLLINAIQAISKVYHFEYYLILSGHDNVQKLNHESLMKKLHFHMKHSTVLDIHIEDYYKNKLENLELSSNTDSRSLIIFNASTEISREKFLKFSQKVNFGGNLIWLIFLMDVNISLEDFLNLLDLPFNSRLLLAVMDEPKYVSFKAPYRVAKNYPLRITDVGKYSNTEGLDLPVIDVATTRQDMEGYRLIAGTWKVLTVYYDKEGKKTPVGHLAEIWHEVSERLNFTYDFSLTYASGTMSPNGTWNGLIGMLVNKEIDVAVMYLTITNERIDYVDFSVPIISSGNKIFYLDVKNQFEWGNLFRPFRMEVWLVILLWFVIISVALAYIFTAEYSRNTKNYSAVFKREFTISESFLIAFRAFTNQGNDTTPESLYSRIAFYSTYLTMAVILPAYSAALVSYLTVQTPYKPFDSLETMLEKKSHYLAVVIDSSEYGYFEEGKEQILRDVYQNLMMPLRIKGQQPHDPEEGINLVCHRKDVAFVCNYLIGKMYADALLRKYGCAIASLETVVSNTDETWAFQKGSPYALMINLELKKFVYKGLVGRFQKQIFNQKNENYNSGYEEINLGHVTQIYSLLLGGIFLSVLILAVEIFISRRKKKIGDRSKTGCRISKKFNKPKVVTRKIKLKFLVYKENPKIIVRKVKSGFLIQILK